MTSHPVSIWQGYRIEQRADRRFHLVRHGVNPVPSGGSFGSYANALRGIAALEVAADITAGIDMDDAARARLFYNLMMLSNTPAEDLKTGHAEDRG